MVRATSVRAIAPNITQETFHSCDPTLAVSPDEWVREPSWLKPVGQQTSTVIKRPAHSPNRLLAQVNDKWRVIDDPLQWILQQRKGNSRQKNSGWRSRSFCGTRAALLRCVREYCGEIRFDALTTLQALPVHHLQCEQPK